MRTHLGARAVQAGALLALVSGMIAVASSPAQAAPPNVQIASVSSTIIASGGRTTVKYSIQNVNPDVPGPNQVRIEVTGMNCSGDCSPAAKIDPGETREFTAILTAPTVAAGDTRQVEVQVRATINNESNTDTATITVRGPDAPQQVRQIYGRVRDTDGDAIAGAQVVMQDSADHRYETKSNGDGGYSFTSSADRPITPGAVSVGAGKDGFRPTAVTVQAGAGRTVNVPLTLKAEAVATPSPTPSATETASEEPVDEVTDGVTADVTETAGANTDAAANNSDGNGSLLFIILGALLVAAGVGAIVLVLMRRKNDDDDDADMPGGVPPLGGGRYNGGGDATRVAEPVGRNATMAASMSGAGSMSDAPTMLQGPAPGDDEFADPYGVPARPQGAYGNSYGEAAQIPAQSGGYADGYDAGQPTQYGRPAYDDAQYGDGYGSVPHQPQQRYDEPTGMHRPEPAYDQRDAYDQGGYGGHEPAYQPLAGHAGSEPTGAAYPSGGYGQGGGGYGFWGAPSGGIDSGNAYGSSSGAGTYGATSGDGGFDGGYAQGGYDDQGPQDQRAGYPGQGYYYDQRGGYDDRGGYDQHGVDDRGGYDNGDYTNGYDQGGYGEQAGRHGGHPSSAEPGGQPGSRRQVNWLDD